MTTTTRPRAVQPPGTLPERPAAGEWPVLRACWRLGPEAAMNDIVLEVQRDAIVDYRYIQTMLKRLVGKGYLSVEKKGPRRNVWSAAIPADEVLAQEVRLFVDRVVGLEPGNIQVLYDALDDLRTTGPFEFVTETSLPRELRARLIAFLEGFLNRKPERWAIASVVGLAHDSLDGEPTLSRAIRLLVAAGGDTVEAARKIVDAAEELVADSEAAAKGELREIRQTLDALAS
ncbi:MAG: BlaI/MecI/CopY family transcriptional regulator [bacterium]|nr:BlaI/MecI/CopY family transcriptional regulator [bacterium]